MLGDPERVADRLGDQRGVADCREIDKARPVGVSISLKVTDPQRQPRFSASAGPGQREQADAVALEHRGELRELIAAAEKRRWRDGEPGMHLLRPTRHDLERGVVQQHLLLELT